MIKKNLFFADLPLLINSINKKITLSWKNKPGVHSSAVRLIFLSYNWGEVAQSISSRPKFLAAVNHYEPISTDVRQREEDVWLLLPVICKKRSQKSWNMTLVEFRHFFQAHVLHQQSFSDNVVSQGNRLWLPLPGLIHASWCSFSVVFSSSGPCQQPSCCSNAALTQVEEPESGEEKNCQAGMRKKGLVWKPFSRTKRVLSLGCCS